MGRHHIARLTALYLSIIYGGDGAVPNGGIEMKFLLSISGRGVLVLFFSSVVRAVTLAGRARRKLAGSVARLIIAIAALCVVAMPLHAAERETRVLILYGPDPTLPSQLVQDAAMRETFAKNPTHRFLFFAEAMDAYRFAFANFEQEFLALLRKKYKDVKFDVVVAVGEPALNLVRRHRSELWLDAWVFFHSVPQQSLQGIESEARMAGVLTRRTVDKTIELARKLQPNARRLLVISGEPGPEKEAVEMARAAFADLPEVGFAFGLPLPELLQRVAQEPADAIVVYYAQSRDREGRPYVPREVLRALAAASPAPVYGTHETYFGAGIAAGVTESYTNRGRMTAERLMQLAAGETIPALSDVPDFCAADARALRKWSLDEGLLPEGCQVLFAERSLWREYRWQILGAIAVLLFQTALIAGLLIERERRRRAAARAETATAETGQYRENLAHLARVHTAGEMSTAIAHEVNQPLAAIKNYAFAARLRLAGGFDDPAKFEELLDKIEAQASRAGDVLHSLRAMMKKHESEPARIEVGQLITDTLKLVEMETRKDDIRLETSIAPDLPPVFVDGIQIQQVVLNLARNAIEAMEDVRQEDSVITVGVRGNGHGEVAVSVADRGPGVAPDDTERIFDPFYSTKTGGLGVGLSLCRAIVEAHGGRLWLNPNAGGGSVFQFTLPAMKTGS
jgi:signal transduction histidine kinase